MSPLAAEMLVLACKQEDYPQVKFWFQDDWRKHEKETKSISGNRVREDGEAAIHLRFIEDESGVPANAERTSEIRIVAYQLWFSLKKDGLAPATWGAVTRKANEFYQNEMYRAFPEMRLCHNHWKASRFATLNYPTWCQSHSGTRQIRSIKAEEGTDQDPLEPLPHKRALSSSGQARRGKKIKVDNTPNVRSSYH
jgi:hypothetical protein